MTEKVPVVEMVLNALLVCAGTILVIFKIIEVLG